MTPENIMLRIEGKRADVVVVKHKTLDVYFVAYEYSKSKGQWRFHMDRNWDRYETSNRNYASATARRVFNNQNGV